MYPRRHYHLCAQQQQRARCEDGLGLGLEQDAVGGRLAAAGLLVGGRGGGGGGEAPQPRLVLLHLLLLEPRGGVLHGTELEAGSGRGGGRRAVSVE